MRSVNAAILTIAFFSAMISCSKNDDNDPAPGQSQRIKTIRDGAAEKIFLYDAGNRIARIDFSGGSFRFVYSSAEITVQTYFSNNTPDPNWKYVFAVSGGRITGGRRYLPNGGIGREYHYAYDGQQRLSGLIMSLKNFTGEEDESHRYEFFYDAQSLMQRVAFTRKSRTGNGLVNMDSSSASVSYFMDRSFINWKQMGFDFFGTATAGIEMQGMEIMPFSFTFTERIIPSDKAVKQIQTQKYRWDQGTNAWKIESTDMQTFSESEHEYSQAGLLQKYKTNIIGWEPYE